MNSFSNFSINNKKYSLKVQGKITKAKDQIIINNEDNLIHKTRWRKKGYFIYKLLDKKIQKKLQNSILKHLKKKIENMFGISLKNYSLADYHKFMSSKNHYKLLKMLDKGIKFQDIKFDKKILEQAVSKKIKINVTTKNPNSKEINKNTFAVRIVRPRENDFNPPHKDIYLDRLKNGVNIYMPIIGSNKFSSLPLLPRSHLFNEKDISKTKNGSIVNDLKYRVSCIINTKFGLKLIRPNPNYNEIMIFSPYLIHGGGLNENKSVTRISMELRFWRNL